MKDRVVTTVEELFDCLEKFCFLDYALLESIISLLLKESQSVVCDLSDYIKQLSLFKKSTTLSEFVKSIEKAQQPSRQAAMYRGCANNLFEC